MALGDYKDGCGGDCGRNGGGSGGGNGDDHCCCHYDHDLHFQNEQLAFCFQQFVGVRTRDRAKIIATLQRGRVSKNLQKALGYTAAVCSEYSDI